MGRRTGTVLLCVIAGVITLVLPASASATINFLIVNPAPIATTEGQVFAGTVATFSDSPGGFPIADYTATVNWGDGTTVAATISGTDAIGYAVASQHSYSEEGTYNVTVTITNGAVGSTTSAVIYDTAQIADATLQPAVSAPSTFSGTGPSGALNALSAFEAGIGGTNNGSSPSPKTNGYRRIGWDDIKLDGSDPGSAEIKTNKTVAIARDREQPSGIELGAPLAVSGDGFASINPSVSAPARFPAFSSANVIAPFNTNTITLNVIAPSSPGTTPIAEATRGLGLVFLNVRQTGATTIQYLSGSNVLTTATVPVGGESVPVFDGVLYSSPVVTGVRITFGGGPIFNFDGVFAAAVNSDVAPTNLVAADDLVQAEPTVEAPNIGATAGAPFSGRLDSFTDPDPNAQPGDFTATIDWGDGRRSTAAVTGSTSLGFSVTGGHTYSQAGTFAVTVTDQDTGGAERVIHFLAEVGTRSTTTGMSCSPATVRVGTASTCTATVTDIAAGSASAPGGTIGFTSPAGGGFASGASCTLVARSATASSCSTTFSPIRTGSVLGAYSGDSAHAASRGAGALAAFGHGCTLGVPSPKLPAHARTLRILTLCDQAVTVKLAATAMIARHGSRRGGKVSLGTATGRVSANRAATLVLHPSARTLAVLRSAAGHHQPISLALSLTATASTTTKATLTLPALKVS